VIAEQKKKEEERGREVSLSFPKTRRGFVRTSRGRRAAEKKLTIG